MRVTSFIVVSLLVYGGIPFSAVNAQELYVFSEPASVMPAGALSVSATGKFLRHKHFDQYRQRYTPDVQIGLTKKLMLHGELTFSDMFSSNLRWESAGLYGQYRFYSSDAVHRHFRMAAFGRFSYSRNNAMFQELYFEGDQTGVQAGLIATQLTRKFAASASLSALQFAGTHPKTGPAVNPERALNFSASAGYLLLPVQYTSFRQTNLNLYIELLGQRSLGWQGAYVDIAPALQLIFNSNARLNIGYRRQVAGSMDRMGERGWLISFERVFLNAIK